MFREILPAVRVADIAGTRASEAAVAGEDGRVPAFPSEKLFSRTGIVVLTAAVEVRRQQHKQASAVAYQAKADEQRDTSSSRR